ncbi:hypothetical protein CYMTET_51648 [Cymbomonas tetramitiformis]|uniref:Uncharacterized protein n=1 Tax=Cymbomonas tetramitiformis TaxID=36881 RepID=A0AAE0ETG9_9CHLO|nr:hypothetical protein CYMTET_51648 [Cymbomonas tetramitiformis]
MLRRICQTSLVVIVRLWNPDVDVIYAMFVAFTAAIIHAYMQPYREALGSQLQAAILYNFCCEQLMLFTSKLMPKDGGLVTTLTFCLVAFQLVLVITVLMCSSAKLLAGYVRIRHLAYTFCAKHFRTLMSKARLPDNKRPYAIDTVDEDPTKPHEIVCKQVSHKSTTSQS